jgi:O-succinylbenzoate synthase
MGVACLKPSRLGGLHAAAAALGDCATAGVAAFVGGFFETGLGRCANLALAGLAGFTIPGDLTSPDRVLDSSPFGYPLVDGGLVEVPDGPGIGAPLDGDRLEACTVWREWFAQGAA